MASSMRQLVKQTFFDRPVLKVAPELLGMYLVRQIGTELIEGMITEVEAYDGPEDLASHSSKGRTARTEVMFGEAGRWYPYFIYGMYWLLNVVAGKIGEPKAILIRGVEGVSGPGRVGKMFQIDKTFYGLPSARASDLWIEDRGVKIPKAKIKSSPRIGVDYAGPIWSQKPYRFYISN
jgi:DNA-3-methyladenine glycosylase